MNVSKQEALDELTKLPPISHIFDNLYVGCWPKEQVPDEYKFIIQCCPHRKPYPIGEKQTAIKGYLYDADDLPPLRQLSPLVEAAKFYSDLGKTLVHCKGGINRSTLVVGLALIQKFRIPPSVVLQLIRERRSPIALNNEVFEKILLAKNPYEGLPMEYPDFVALKRQPTEFISS